jgi:hypothetical protein
MRTSPLLRDFSNRKEIRKDIEILLSNNSENERFRKAENEVYQFVEEHVYV